MRQTLNELTAHIKKSFARYEELAPFKDIMIPVELMAVACSMMNLQLPLKKSWILLTGFNEPVVPKTIDQSILIRLRLLLYSYYGESTWSDFIEQYQCVPSEHRLLSFDK